MKVPFAFDTASLISLGHTGLIDSIVEHFKIVVTTGIIEELKGISRYIDEDAKAAKKWLDVSDHFTIIDVEKKKCGEDELFDICKKDNAFLITDDIKAIKRFQNEIKCYYSIHIVYMLYGKGIISRERAILSIEKMRIGRSWKSNVIAATARTLFKYKE